MNNSDKTPETAAKKRSIRFRYGGTAVLFTAVVVLLLLVLNVIVSLLVERNGWKADMTTAGMYNLSEDTKRVVDELEESVNIRVFSQREDFFDELTIIFDRYETESHGKISVEYLDPYLSDGLVQEYASEGVQIQDSYVVIEGAGRRRVYDPLEFYDIDYDSYEIKAFRAEQVVTSSLLYIGREELPTVTFSVGHNEMISNALLDLFENNNFEITQVFLSNGQVDDETDILVIAAPSMDYTAGELEALDAFLLRGGKLMVFLSPTAEGQYERLRSFLKEWGIVVTDYTVFEPENHILGSPLNVTANYADHSITDYFSDYQVFTVMPSAKALEKDFDSRSNIVVSEVLVSSADAYAKTGTAFENVRQEVNDLSGKFALALTASRQVKVGTEFKTAQVFVAGCPGIYAQDVMETTAYGNLAFLGQVLQWCTEKEQEIISIPAKSYRIETLAVPEQTARLFGRMIMLWIPLGCLVLGAGVWLRRRYL